MSKHLRIPILLCALFFAKGVSAQIKGIYLIKNCQRSTLIDNYYKQVKFFWWWMIGNTDFQQQKLLHFAEGYRPDSAALRKDKEKLRSLLPKEYNYAGDVSIGLLRDNRPDEKAIWFTEVFAEHDKKTGTFKVYGAYKITFEGTNAHEVDTKKPLNIKSIQFIFEEADLQALGKRLAELPVSQDIHS